MTIVHATCLIWMSYKTSCACSAKNYPHSSLLPPCSTLLLLPFSVRVLQSASLPSLLPVCNDSFALSFAVNVPLDSKWVLTSWFFSIFLPVWSQYLYSTMYRVPVRGIMLHHRSRQILFFAFHLEIPYGKLWCAMHVPRQGGRESEREIERESCQIRSDR